MNTAPPDLRQVHKVRELVDLHLPVVVGAALKLALSGGISGDEDNRRRASGLTAYHWQCHSSRVIRLAASLRSILPPT